MVKNILYTKIGVLNLTIVAAIGVLMRYKIGFEFPYFDQKHLHHAHSHFAFSGWVTHILFVLMVLFLKEQIPVKLKPKRYDILILTNLVCAFGMLISFTVQGYGPISIIFSTLSILVGYIFSWFYFLDLKEVGQNHPSKNWFKAALLFNVLSSFGTFYLAYMMASKHIHQNAYLESVYFYLHFQYSGWFFFAMMGLLMSKLNFTSDFIYDRSIFNSFFVACIPAYLLSVLWLNLPWYVYVFPLLAVILQLYGLFRFLLLLRTQLSYIAGFWAKEVRIIFGLALCALVIKLLLQAGSIFPEISKLAFGFRSIVIAYLHLVLLGITTLFLMGYLLFIGLIRHVKISSYALMVFCIGIFANELVLMIQGIASFGYIMIPFLNEILLFVSVIILFSLIALLLSYIKSIR